MNLHDHNGQRKYLTPAERDAFLDAAGEAEREVRTFCATLLYTGCRISEALELTADRVDLKAQNLIFESLKKRKRGIFRAVPVPAAFVDTLNIVHDLRVLQRRRDRGKGVRLWTWSRAKASYVVANVMRAAGITGPHASAKGLRHGFGIKAVTASVPLNMLQKWLGHAQLATTSIYADATGEEARTLAERMWT